ncbi:AAA family ATPase [Pseudomonas aeruginosa]|uniref:AAA family ATPase n=1 Tax=Pseudomonas aeruginosa TaxID=287 RepID=UPI00141A9859|nr:AAA family ATPase [Pseudomonas aeruginosa]MBH4372228.1 AAA family ATPase [Pseudomonas aeruginosa]MBN0025381.1 AAA family ATPase [Pseudomonas aeruginosa]MBN0051051.1 AAA family ATPase [Pseudomonas aeruginosa]MBN0066451.1 AAA family ATPase [Pseudomonas aeruginosa]MBN0104631.1 AAA family ATPase [Pseudomonas aeruginosa]
MIHLNKITLKNFKIFGGEPYTISFEDSNLVLLDGPNGYGKTSVFDAIELGLTGNITRLISLENRQNPADIVVAHNGAENVEIILEFKNKDSKLKIFQRKLKTQIPNISKRISRFADLWELNEIIDGKSFPTHQNALEQYFDSQNFPRDFLLFHYVQQEETARFLKTNNETQRAEELAQLFGNTREADERLSKLADISRKVAASKRSVTSRIESIKYLYKIDDNTSIAAGDIEPHVYAFPWLAKANKSPFWDAITIAELNQEKLNSSLVEINYTKSLLAHQHFFVRSRRFENAALQREVLELYIGYYNSINDHDLHITRSSTYQLIRQSYTTLKSGDSKLIRTINSFETIFQALTLGSSAAFETALQTLIEEENKASGLSSIYSELLNHHDAMSAGLQKVPNEAACLLCGHDYKTHDALAHAIAQHGHLIRSQLSGQDRQLVAARDSFNTIHLSPLLQTCATYLERTAASTQEDLLALSKALAAKERFEKLRKWLLSERIEHDDLLATTFPVQGGYNYIAEATGNLCERIRSAIGAAPEGYYEANGANVFERIYRDYFNGEQDKLALVSIDLLDKKEIYIKSLYFNSLKEISEELAKLLKQYENLERAASDVGELITIVRTQIRQYRKKLITDIEIPFYIYSGKILQTHQAGLGHGIFIKDPTGEDELKNVRLVSNWESDHDILNTMSSGQISAVVIALTLALHRVYSTKFSSILIDDPVQTMDDINMASLVEVLRNDFSEKQIILSTHEDKVARYFTYKYLKHSENVKIINLMQRKEYVPSNKYLYRSESAS